MYVILGDRCGYIHSRKQYLFQRVNKLYFVSRDSEDSPQFFLFIKLHILMKVYVRFKLQLALVLRVKCETNVS